MYLFCIINEGCVQSSLELEHWGNIQRYEIQNFPTHLKMSPFEVDAGLPVTLIPMLYKLYKCIQKWLLHIRDIPKSYLDMCI